MRKSPREKDGKREEVNGGRSCMTVVKAVREGGIGFGALSPGDVDAPAEWLCGGAGYAGVRRRRKEVWFYFRHCRTMADAQRRARCGGSRGIRAENGTV